MKCPFLKRIIYSSTQNTGAGYPRDWVANEEFQDCIGEKCAAFGSSQEFEGCGLAGTIQRIKDE